MERVSEANTSDRKEYATLQNSHAIDTQEIFSLLKTNRETGLSIIEAKQRLAKYGPNTIEKERAPSPIRILAAQFSNILIIILLAATIVSGLLGELVDALVILVIVALVAALGFTQEYRTERVISALKKMQNHRANVIRDGAVIEIQVEEIVPGDIVIVGAGDKVSADMRIIETFNLLVDEAALTGESVAVGKSTLRLDANTPVADRNNMLFSGTSITNGKGVAVAVSTGMRTELGKIAQEVTERTSKSSTSLERRMNEIGRKIGALVLGIVVIVVVVSLAEEYYLTGGVPVQEILAIMLFGVALAVAAIPEALPAILVGSLAIGAHRMAQENALTRNLSAVETLGSTQIVCTDKTGTLTKGEMTATEFYTFDNAYSATGIGYEPTGVVTAVGTQDDSILASLARAMILCNDAVLFKNVDTDRWAIKGDTTEGALIVLAEKLGFSQQTVRSDLARVWEIPFSSEAKRMTTVHAFTAGKEIAYMKGAHESVLEKCAYLLRDTGVERLDAAKRERLHKAAESMATRSLRVLALAMRELAGEPHSSEAIECNFVFLGLVGMIDPPRPEAIEAIRSAKKIGMKPIMITGDHKTTAVAIASQMGIYQDSDLALTGEQFQSIDDQEYEKIVEDVTVYARVTPFDKLRIVEAWQKKDRIVAMTGDGVNDAPALKKADIGIAMGITGTEVAKDASDMILLDDNFATIMKAVRLGRWIQDNVKKYLAYLLSANLAEIIVLSVGALVVSLFVANVANAPLVPLLAVQVLYINLATDGLPALAVGIGPPDPDVMERQVQRKGEPVVFSPDVRRFIYWILIAETPLLILIYLTGVPEGIGAARTRLFLVFVFVELVLAINCSSLRFPFYKVKPHVWLILSVVWEGILIAILIYLPQTRNALQLLTPTIDDIEWTIVAMVFTFIYIEVLKHFYAPSRNLT